MAANFYVAITPNPHGMNHLVTGGHNRVLYYVKVGDTALIDNRVTSYYTANPDVALFPIQIAVYDVLDIRTDASIRRRLELQFNTTDTEALYTRHAGKVVEKCVFDTNHGRALRGIEWYGVVDRENELRNLFPQWALFENRIGITRQTAPAFIDELFAIVNGHSI